MRTTTIIIFFTMIIFSILVISGCSSNAVVSNKYDELAKCLSANNAVMYGTSWCPHCQNQKKMFSNSFEYINFVDCDASSDACKAAGVQGYPTWVINGTSYEGEQTVYTLAKSAGCLDALANSSTAN